ncbi:putative multicopper oxidase [Candidatus Protochlamydia naegleriophila]|uniref:Purine nucleoside phosphorylase n=1 Tax=Candidatus Protochlamydia naegleriophila TaxID=389348 RepID=A0A0U5EUH8_9BACT|nr:peptidoglycan editing factor PgeF [Candidatus Protochlamydia naegleriophila]CUI17841.1 putative multicopper oxidase [Candidatus Protochlamydia naegleriophila]
MQRFKQNNIEWLEFDLLADIPHLKHAVFLRHGGLSQAPFNSLNTSLSVGDNAAAVENNRALIAKQSKGDSFNWSHMVTGQGCHGKYISYVERHTPHTIPQCDGLLSSTPGITLMMTHADCQIGLFYDPHHRIIANIHSGWRGSVQNIYAETISQMQRRFGSNPADLLVCISPSLGPDESEFIHYSYELPEEFWSFQIRPTYFDFWSISEYQLQNAGILPHHIEIARLSTYSNANDYFSYRRDKITGRHATCITLL